MNLAAGPLATPAPADSGLAALCGISAYYRIAANPSELRRRLALGDQPADFPDLVRAAQALGLRARWVRRLGKQRLGGLPAPCLVRVKGAGIQVYGGKTPDKLHRLVDPITREFRDLTLKEFYKAVEPQAGLLPRKLGGARRRARGFSPRLCFAPFLRHPGAPPPMALGSVFSRSP